MGLNHVHRTDVEGTAKQRITDSGDPHRLIQRFDERIIDEQILEQLRAASTSCRSDLG